MLLFQTMLNYNILQDENTTVWREKMVKFEKCLVIGVPGGVTKGLEKWAAKSDIQINQKTTLSVTKRLLKKY